MFRRIRRRTTVPRPPASNDSFARGNNSVNNHGTMNGSSQRTAGAPTAHNSAVPRPPANYNYHAPSGTPQQSSPSHQSAPSQHAAPQGNSHGSSHSGSTATSRSYGSAPRPPAGYSYHAAPAYSASSSYAAGRMGTSSYGGSSRSSYPSGSYYGSSRSYGSSPTLYGRSYGSAGSYSAPRYSRRTIRPARAAVITPRVVAATTAEAGVGTPAEAADIDNVS